MDALRRNNRNSYMRQEIEVRRQARLPPFVSLAAIIVSGNHNAEVEKLARQVRGIMPKACDVEVLGPAPAPMSLVRGRHRWRFLVKAEKKVDLQAFLRAWLQPVEPKGSLRIDIDVDPYNFL
jgi:primosomal protein N' (replication factor Y)